MTDDRVEGVMAHDLLNTATSVQGLVAAARSLADPASPEGADMIQLLSTAERRVAEMCDKLQLLARGIPVIIDLDEVPESHRASEDAPEP